MDPKELFAKAVQQATSCIKHIQPKQMGNSTPCDEWDLKALFNHMVYELLWVPDLLRGKTVEEVGRRFVGDVLRTDYLASWQHAADAALVAVHGANLADTVHLSYGDVKAEHYIKEIGADILIHAWDVGQAIKCTLLLDKDAAKAAYDFLLPRQDELASSGTFGPAVEVADDADIQAKLLGLSGRKA